MTPVVNTRRKRVSKKKKTAWRKHIDIKDVEDFLDDKRLEERLGKPFDSRSDNELFIIDTVPESNDENANVSMCRRKQKRLVADKTPKCFAVLLPDSKVEDPNKKRNFVKLPGSKPTDLSKVTEARKLKKGILQNKLNSAAVNKQIVREKRLKAKRSREDFEGDIWVEPSKSMGPVQNEWLTRDIVKYALRKQRPASGPKTAQPAVQTPHPGLSYNPSFEDHQALLREVAQKEQILVKKEAHLNRVTTKMFKMVKASERETLWLKEMLAGLPAPLKPTEPSLEKGEESEGSDTEYKAINPPVQNKRKDSKSRRKQKERRQDAHELKKIKLDKKKVADVYKLRFLQNAIERTEERLQKLREIRQLQQKERSAEAVPKLNAHKFQEPELDFAMAHEIAGNLRNLRTTGNLLKDRYQSLQKRSILAPSKIYFKKKVRVKTYIKQEHRIKEADIARYSEIEANP